MLNLTFKNVGPLSAGSIDVSPLTVLVGPNNSGKSVVAMSVYAAVHARAQSWTYIASPRAGQRMRIMLSGIWSPGLDELNENEAAELTTQLLELVNRPSRITARNIDRELRERLDGMVRSSLTDYAKSLAHELERCFGEKTRSLVRAESASSWIEVKHTNPPWRVRLHLAGAGSRRKIDVLSTPNVVSLVERMRSNPSPEVQRMARNKKVPTYAYTSLMYQLLEPMFSSFPRSSYYLPAARSGILQSHKALASFVMSRSSLVGIEDMNIPRMSGVITDFIGELLRMEPRRSGRFHAIAEQLEKTLLQGDIGMRVPANGYPEISYRNVNGKFPLHRTSSMVSEVAPVVLYLRNVLDAGDLLLVEEPESHLHPHSQAVFASAIAQLVSEGLPILMTTHSDYFLSAINNAIRSGELVNRSGHDEASSPPVDPQSASAYAVRVTNSGNRLERLQVTPSEGIPEDEFLDVAESLYDQSAQLEEALLSLEGASE